MRFKTVHFINDVNIHDTFDKNDTCKRDVDLDDYVHAIWAHEHGVRIKTDNGWTLVPWGNVCYAVEQHDEDLF